MSNPITPTKWLWSQLDTLLTPLQIAELRVGFQAQQQRYNRASQIRQTKREIAQFERIITLHGKHSPQARRYADRLVQRRTKLAALQASEETT